MSISPWIKLEHTTPDKPEFVRMAARLRMDQDSIVGKAIRFWVYCDQHGIAGDAMPITEKFIDKLVGKRGFAAALREVGWLDGNDGNLFVTNYERHNGQTAKSRAMANQRKDRQREKCHAPNVTFAGHKRGPEEEEEEDIKRSHSRAGGPVETLPANHDEAIQYAGPQMIPEDFIRATFDRCMAVGFIDTQKRPIASWPHYLAKSWHDEQARAKAGTGRASKDGPVPWQRNQHVVVEKREDF